MDVKGEKVEFRGVCRGWGKGKAEMCTFAEEQLMNAR